MLTLQRLAFALFPVSLLAVAAVGIEWALYYQLSPWLLAALVVLAVLCVPLSLRLRSEVRRTCEVESVRERVRALEEQERVSAAYRQKILADEEDIREARRRVAEEVDEARAMVAARDVAAASRRLSCALELMGDGAYRQCDHPSADAMVSMKAQACREAGVDPQFALEIPRDIPVSAVDLCAVLGNLADNGLAAAERAREAGVTPYLRLRSVMRDGYLVITAQNPLCEADNEALQARAVVRSRRRLRTVASHGWGLSIVASVAARYGGEMTPQVTDGTFRVTVVLNLEEGQEAGSR